MQSPNIIPKKAYKVFFIIILCLIFFVIDIHNHLKQEEILSFAESYVTAVSTYNYANGLIDYDKPVNYFIDGEQLLLSTATIKFEKNVAGEWVIDSNPPFYYNNNYGYSPINSIHDAICYKKYTGGDASTWGSNSKTFSNNRIKITFPNACLGSNGVHYPLVMYVSNVHFEVKDGVVIMDEPLMGNDDWGLLFTSERLNMGINFDVSVSVASDRVSDSDVLYSMIYDLDAPGFNYSYEGTFPYNYNEGVQIVSGIYAGTVPHVPANYVCKITNGAIPSYSSTGGTSGDDSYRAGVSYLGYASGTTIRWFGHACGTYFGMFADELAMFLHVQTHVRTETASSNVTGDKSYTSYYGIDGVSISSLQKIPSYSYTLTNDIFRSYALSKNWVSSADDSDWIFDFSEQTVGETNITTSKNFYITVNRNRYTYSFNSNLPIDRTSSDISGMPNNKTVVASTDSSGKSDATVSSPSLSGYRFKGWNTKANGTGSDYPGVEIMKSDKTFYAQWQRANYIVKFNANGSSNPNHETGEQTQNTTDGIMSDQAIDYDVATPLNANQFTREGYTFHGWNTKADGSGTAYSDQQSVTNLVGYDDESITLYAQWTKKLGTETITVISEDTGNKVSDVSLKLQKKVNGTWTDVKTAATDINGTITVSDLHWFNYQWIMIDVPAGYRLSSSNTTFNITYNNLTAENEIILYKIGYKIRYNANGSSNPNHYTGEFTQNTTTGTMADSEYIYNVTGTLRKNTYAREGYTFIGWNTKADGSGTAYTDEYNNVLNWSNTDGEIVTLYAQWTKKLGTETITVISEETGNPVSNVILKLYKDVNGTETYVTTATTGSGGSITIDNLHWFNYKWVIEAVPAGYVKSSDTDFTINYNKLEADNEVILYMKHVTITLDSRIDCIIEGENAPAFLYHIDGIDAAGVRHEYNVLVQTDGNTKTGMNSVMNIFAGTYTITQIPVSRYKPEIAENISHATINDINAAVNVLNYDSAEVLFPYTLTNHGWYSGTDSIVNQLTK